MIHIVINHITYLLILTYGRFTSSMYATIPPPLKYLSLWTTTVRICFCLKNTFVKGRLLFLLQLLTYIVKIGRLNEH